MYSDCEPAQSVLTSLIQLLVSTTSVAYKAACNTYRNPFFGIRRPNLGLHGFVPDLDRCSALHRKVAEIEPLKFR